MAVVTDNTQRPDSGPNSAPELPTQYAPAEVEGPLYERWVERGYFEADAKSEKPAYTIVIPPPNVTGSLHLGHAFEHTLIDALTRRKRMQGYETLWQPGMDHAGYRDPERRRARTRQGRQVPPRPGPRGVRRARLAVEGRVRRPDRRPDAPPGQRRRLGPRPLHHGRGSVPGRPDRLQAAVRRRPDLPRRAHHQLVPALPDGHLRHRGRLPGRRRRARLHRVRRRLGRDRRRRHHPRRDDAR